MQHLSPSIAKVYVFLTFLTFLLCIDLGFSQGLNTIVIDPGHGGKDHGCSGKHSIEKHLTLDIAYKLKNRLSQQSPQIEVKMTRTHDVFIPLEERCAFANKVEADLFISIHCNQIDIESVHGTETYVLGENAERDIESILAREQAYYHPQPTNSYGEHLNYILAQAYHQQNLKESIQLASIIMDQMAHHTELKRRQIKQANFKVLKGLYMPGVLIETGFLSNQHDESYLLSNAGQYAVADGINAGLQHYIEHSIEYEPIPTGSVTRIQARPQFHVETPKQEKYGIIIARTIGSTANVSRPEWKAITHYDIYVDEETYYYITGDFNSRDSANSALRALQQNGFKGAYIQNYQNMQSLAKLN